MKSKLVLTSLMLLLVFTSLSFKCDGGPPPDNSKFRPAAKACGDIAEAIKAMIVIKRALAKDGTLKPAEERPLTDALLKLTRADKTFCNEVTALKSEGEATANKGKLCQALAALKAALAGVDSTVTPVGNADAKSKLANALTTIMNLIPTASDVLQCS